MLPKRYQESAKCELVFDDPAYHVEFGHENHSGYKKPIYYICDFVCGFQARDNFLDMMLQITHQNAAKDAGGQKGDKGGHQVGMYTDSSMLGDVGGAEDVDELMTDERRHEMELHGLSGTAIQAFLGSWLTRPVPETMKGRTIVDIVIWGADHLAPKDKLTKSSDPYVHVSLVSGGKSKKSQQANEKSFKTKTVVRNLSPVWNEKGSFVVGDRYVWRGEARGVGIGFR